MRNAPATTGGLIPAPARTADQLGDFLAAEFPQAFYPGCGLTIEKAAYGNVCVRRAFDAGFLRPGGTISGPTMMTLADFAMYVAVLSAIGAVPLAVTANLNVNFLRKPAQADLLAGAKLLKVGKRLAMGEVTIIRMDRTRRSPMSPRHIPSPRSGN